MNKKTYNNEVKKTDRTNEQNKTDVSSKLTFFEKEMKTERDPLGVIYKTKYIPHFFNLSVSSAS